jgi:hypothetical protein
MSWGMQARRRADAAGGARALDPGEVAWLLVLPAAALAIGVALVLAHPLGRLLFTGAHYEYWPTAAQSQLQPKPTQLARFVLAVAAMLAFAATVLAVARRRPSARDAFARAAVPAVQLACVALLVVFWIRQRDVHVGGLPARAYFTTPTIAVAVLLALAGAAALVRLRGPAWLAPERLGSAAGVACTVAALTLTAVWLLPSIFTDRDVVLASAKVTHHLEFAFDESMSVLDHRSPLVDMAVYGALVPYVVALPLSALGATLTAFTGLMTLGTLAALLAICAVLRRVTRNPLAALALYAPFVATSLFVVEGGDVERFDYGNYYMMFPIRYAGPYLLAWLTARQLDGDRPRRPELLFAAAGLVALNNTDFGLPALGATLVALLCARPPRRAGDVAALARQLALGLAAALAAVSVLTLLRAGTLPHLGLLLRYARLFGVAGFGNLPTPLLGFHLVVVATFLAALTTAVVRVARGDAETTLTGMLAWTGVFGIGATAYYVYRSAPDSLISLFSIWALALALLGVAVVRSARARVPRRVTVGDVAVLLGLGLAACSLAQVPGPAEQLQRIARRDPAQTMVMPEARAFVASRTRPGERVAILTSLGHRLAYETGTVNVSAYTGMWQMPTVEQLRETARTLRREGGDKLFLGQYWWPEAEGGLRALGFRRVRSDGASGFVEWVAPRAGGQQR